MQAGEVQKEAHLSFYLGITFENNKKYKKVCCLSKKLIVDIIFQEIL